MPFREIVNMARKFKELAHWQLKGRLAVTLTIAGLLSGCSVSSGMCDAFGPSKRASMAIPQSASVEKVFACIDQESVGNADRGYVSEKKYAIRDVQSGVLETEHYSIPNVAGFRLRAEVSKQASRLDLSLRGAGAYCTDLGVDKEMARLTSDVASCLQR